MPVRTPLFSFAFLLVMACHGSGHSQPPAPAGSPIAPSGLAAEFNTQLFRIELQWLDNSNDEEGFVIERYATEREWLEHATVPANTTTFLDLAPNLLAETYYSYRIRASNAAGWSQHSNLASVRTPESPAPNCTLVIETQLNPTTPRRPTDSETTFWLVSDEAGTNRVTAQTAVPAFGTSAFGLSAGWLGTSQFQVKQQDSTRMRRWDLDVQFPTLGAPYEGMTGNVCLMLHDSGSSPSVMGPNPGVGNRSPHVATVLGARLPIRPEEDYRVRILFDQQQQNFDVWWGLWPIATDVALDEVLVVPAIYLHPR
ncbi:MAG: fibronectin type III domain-containing protein [Planctomycetota bacterium]|nr:fibronectin type III domain-containing protein [Planctomycetota bacterium]